jgi:hypothetical protein
MFDLKAVKEKLTDEQKLKEKAELDRIASEKSKMRV